MQSCSQKPEMSQDVFFFYWSVMAGSIENGEIQKAGQFNVTLKNFRIMWNPIRVWLSSVTDSQRAGFGFLHGIKV